MPIKPRARSWTDNALTDAVHNNITVAGVLRCLQLSVSPGNYRSVHHHIRRMGLDTTHFKGQAHGTSPSVQKPLDEILVLGSQVSSSWLRARLIKEGLLKNACYQCGLLPCWQGQPLTLQLDHINGDPFDNRLENLRVLCPNCHAQTKTFAGRNRTSGQSRYDLGPMTCTACGTPIKGDRFKCHSCASPRKGQLTIEWPPPDAVAEAVVESSYAGVARVLGVTDTAVKRYLRTRLGHCPRKHRRCGVGA